MQHNGVFSGRCSLPRQDLPGTNLRDFVINDIISTQVLFVYPKPLTFREKNLIANIHRRPMFILAEARNINLK